MTGTVRTLDLFAGLGGLSLALPPGFAVVAAYDQDAAAAQTHEQNHGIRVNRKNLARVDAAELQRHEAAAWLLSPPCQPFTRRGRRRDIEDPRCAALLRLVEILPACRPAHVLVENVPGFHGSRAHRLLVDALREIDHEVRDVELCPSELGAPVRRRRQFVVSSREGLRQSTAAEAVQPSELEACLDSEPDPSLFVPAALREKFEDNLRGPGADGLLGAFTRSYGRALSGAGPVLWSECGPRWLSPEEILRLHRFPVDFRFPEVLSRRDRWRLAGNSVHVGCVRHVASALPQQAAA